MLSQKYSSLQQISQSIQNFLFQRLNLRSQYQSQEISMGNDLCNTTTHEPELARKLQSIQSEVQQQPSTNLIVQEEINSNNIKNQPSQYIHPNPQPQTQPQPQPQPLTINNTIRLPYNQFIIQCQAHQIHHPTTTTTLPSITGQVKVYKSPFKQQSPQLIYEGEMRNSKFDGYGKLYQQSQIFYQGQFKNGLFDGWGITDQYTGQWRQGLFDGYGIYQQFQNDNKQTITFYYEGYFQNGLYSGSGVLIKGAQLSSKQIQSIHQQKGIIDYLNQQIEHDMKIIQKSKAKQIYIGQFSNGYKHGFGRLFNDKIQFSGQFSHNLYHGIGTIFNRTQQGKKVIQAVFKMGKQYKLS